uniref:CCHC-type domain-containing protein n=1 Tax=Panagrolaimus superbus TaxID=310955 RepID=A0A914Y9I7_9BILA
MIPETLVVDMEIHLGTSIGWLFDQVQTQSENVEHLSNEKQRLEDEIEALAEDKSQLLAQLAKERGTHPGLSTIELRQLELLGIKDVKELINQVRFLQVKVAQLEADKSRGLLKAQASVSTATTQSQSTWPPVQGGLRFSTLGGKYQHDSLMQRKACYSEVKRELLNALGSDSSAATYSMRTSLDKLIKPSGKSYRMILEEIEQKVAEAFGDDQGQREQELKKILLRLTQEDPDTTYCNITLPYTAASYYRLKELVLGTEDANKLRKQNSDLKQSVERKQPVKAFQPVRVAQRYPPSLNTVPPRNSVNDTAAPQRPPGFEQTKDSVAPPGFGQQKMPSFVRQTEGNQGRVQQGQRFAPKCYECHGYGHFAKDCSVRGEAHVVEEGDDCDQLEFTVSGIVPINVVSSSDPVKLFGEKTLLETRFDGIKVVSMLDSGACVSVISDTVLKGILRDKSRQGKITRERPETYKGSGLVGANGSKLNVVDCVRIPISWGEYEPSPAIFFVVAGLQQDVLIGTNVLKGNPTWLHALEYALEAKAEFQRKRGSGAKAGKDRVQAEHQAGAFVGVIGWNVTAAEHVVIQPKTLKMLKVRTPFSKTLSLIESSKPGIETGVVRSRRGKAWVEYRNYTDETQVIHKNEVIGEAWPVRLGSATDGRESDNPVNIIADCQERVKKLKEQLNLQTTGLSAEGKLQLVELLEKYHEAFAVTDDEFGLTNVTEHSIDTGDARPIKQPARPVPIPLKPQVREMVDTMLKQKVISPSSSAWNSPVVLEA